VVRNEDDRPVHLDVNLDTGAVTHVPVTDAEWLEIEARGAAAVAEETARQRQDEQLRQAVADHPDPVVQALAKRAGVV